MEGTWFQKIESHLKDNGAQFEDLLIKYDRVIDDLGATKSQVLEPQQQMKFVNRSLQSLLAGKEKLQHQLSSHFKDDGLLPKPEAASLSRMRESGKGLSIRSSLNNFGCFEIPKLYSFHLMVLMCVFWVQKAT